MKTTINYKINAETTVLFRSPLSSFSMSLWTKKNQGASFHSPCTATLIKIFSERQEICAKHFLFTGAYHRFYTVGVSPFKTSKALEILSAYFRLQNTVFDYWKDNLNSEVQALNHSLHDCKPQQKWFFINYRWINNESVKTLKAFHENAWITMLFEEES